MSDDYRTRPGRGRLGGFAPKSWFVRGKRWFLFDGERAHVTGALLLGVFVVLLFLRVVWPIEYRSLLTETTMVQTVFNTLLSGVILLVSIVVTVASVSISQELTSLGTQHERIDSAVDFQSEIDERNETDVSPARPGQVLVVVLRSISERAADVAATLDDPSTSPEFRTAFGRLKDDIDENVEELADALADVRPGSTHELLVGLDYDVTWQLHETRRFQRRYDDALSDDQRELLASLSEALQEFMTSREYFRTVYYKREFSDLSTMLLTVSLPVIVFITYVLIALDAGLFPDVRVLGFSPLTVFISLAYTVALAPYTILTAYVFRAATVTKESSAVGPFTVQPDHQLSFDSDVLRSDSDD